MNLPDITLSIVVPVKDGEDRLAVSLDALDGFRRAQPFATEVVLVDDGSAAPAARILDAWGTRDGFTLLRNDVNRGKGHAVARGLLAARGAYRVFTDADLAYPIEEVGKVLAALRAGNDVVVACRVLPESRYLMSPSLFQYLYTRHLLSRLFNALAQHTLLPGILDSQAGLKGLTANAVGRVVPRLTIPGFAFDVELLHVARVQGCRIAQIPVFFRYESEPTTVRFVEDSWQMARDVLRIRWNHARGRYA